MNAIERVWQRLVLMVGRGRVQTAIDDASVQALQVLFSQGEVRDATPRLAEYGYTSSPPPGSDAIVLFIAGDRSNGVVIATGHQASRLRGLQPGEAAMFDDQGQSVFITRTGIVINSAGKPVTINGNLQLNGTLNAAGEGTFNGHTVGAHTHTDPQGGSVGSPTG